MTPGDGRPLVTSLGFPAPAHPESLAGELPGAEEEWLEELAAGLLAERGIRLHHPARPGRGHAMTRRVIRPGREMRLARRGWRRGQVPGYRSVPPVQPTLIPDAIRDERVPGGCLGDPGAERIVTPSEFPGGAR
jgi:hypothetical protein